MKNRYFYFLSFIEGGAVMTAELIGAKLLAPYFGTSLYIWAATLGVTLGGLMIGYYIGGKSTLWFKDSSKMLHYVLALASFVLSIMPWISPWIMEFTVLLSLQLGAVVSLLIFLFPPLFFMGMVSPIIIKIITQSKEEAGNRAGNIYAISTLGGILFTFLMGFYIIPEYGLKWPAIFSGLLLLSFPVVWFLKKNFISSIVLTLFFVLLTACSLRFPYIDQNQNIIFTRESLLGQIKVVDFEDGSQQKLRALLVNNTMQTVEYLDNSNLSFWEYPDYILKLLDNQQKGSKGLLLGVGGGTILRRLDQRGYIVDAVEIDPYIIQVAKDYFGLDKNRFVYTEDARYFIRKTSDLYDFIIFDVLKGESAPEHLLTKESIGQTMNLLNPEGSLLINFYGYLEGDLGLAARSVIKTIIRAGFKPEAFFTSGSADFRNMIIKISQSSYQNGLQNYLPEGIPDLSDAFILEDQLPRSNIFLRPGIRWRQLNNNWYFSSQ